MNNHTPGPYTMESNGSCAVVHDSMGNTVAQFPKFGVGFVDGEHPAPWHNAEANARLFVAAPELLEALGDFVQAHSEEFGRNPFIESALPDHPIQKAWLKARAAIAKAKGEQ